jgi:hypothetical protein
MLIIRSEQLNAIGLSMEADYIDRLIHYIKDKTPSLFDHLDDNESKQRVEAAVLAARKIGIKSDEGILKYVTLTLLAGNGFIESKEVEQFLRMPGYSFDSKLDSLISRVVKNLKELNDNPEIKQQSGGTTHG